MLTSDMYRLDGTYASCKPHHTSHQILAKLRRLKAVEVYDTPAKTVIHVSESFSCKHA